MSASQLSAAASGFVNHPLTGRSVTSYGNNTRTRGDNRYSSFPNWKSWIPFYNHFNVPRYLLTPDGWLIKCGYRMIAGPTRYYADAEILMKRTLTAMTR